MTLRLVAIACSATLAGCATTVDPAAIAERHQRQEVTGSSIKKKVRPEDYAGMQVGDREAFAKELSKASGPVSAGGGM